MRPCRWGINDFETLSLARMDLDSFLFIYLFIYLFIALEVSKATIVGMSML